MFFFLGGGAVFFGQANDLNINMSFSLLMSFACMGAHGRIYSKRGIKMPSGRKAPKASLKLRSSHPSLWFLVGPRWGWLILDQYIDNLKSSDIKSHKVWTYSSQTGTDLAIDISQEDFNATLKNTPGFFKYSVVSYPARIAGWKIHHGCLKTEECSICYVSLLEGTHNFWKLQENYNLDSTLQGILMYWPMHVLRQQQFLPLLGHLHSHLVVKLWWWNRGATGAVMGFIQIGFSWESHDL